MNQTEKGQKTGAKDASHKKRVLSGAASTLTFQQKMNLDLPPYVREYLNYMLTIKGRSVQTVESYYRDLKLFFQFLMVYQNRAALADFHTISVSGYQLDDLKKIRLADIYAFLNFCMQTLNNADCARARKASCLRGFFKYLQKMNYIADNPVQDLEMPSLKKRLPKHLTLDESMEMLENVSSSFPARDFCILTFLLNCGMRVSELVGINISSIQNTAMSIIGKGNKERIVYLNQACVDALTAYMKERSGIKELREPNALFLSQNGDRLTKRRVQQIVETNLRRNGLVGFSTHKLRHTAATLLYQYGHVDIRVLKELLGHASLSTTEIYTHVSNEQVENAVAQSPLKQIKPPEKKWNAQEQQELPPEEKNKKNFEGNN